MGALVRDVNRGCRFFMCVVLAGWLSPLSAAELSGVVALTSGGKPLRASEAADAIVYFRPKSMVSFDPPTERAVMTTRRKQFSPRLLAIAAGTTVQFPNEDVILHNAFSSSTGNVFDTGVYGVGEGATHTFSRPGLVKVYCNVHHSMVAHILVLDTPYFARPDAQGRFVLSGLPDGEGDLVVVHDRSAPVRQLVNTATQGEILVEVALTTQKVPPHANKFGKPYGRPHDGDRY